MLMVAEMQLKDNELYKPSNYYIFINQVIHKTLSIFLTMSTSEKIKPLHSSNLLFI